MPQTAQLSFSSHLCLAIVCLHHCSHHVPSQKVLGSTPQRARAACTGVANFTQLHHVKRVKLLSAVSCSLIPTSLLARAAAADSPCNSRTNSAVNASDRVCSLAGHAILRFVPSATMNKHRLVKPPSMTSGLTALASHVG